MNNPVAMPADGVSHFKSPAVICAGLVQMAFWSSARFFRKFRSLGCVSLSVGALAAAGWSVVPGESIGSWAGAARHKETAMMAIVATACNGNPGKCERQF